MIRLIKHPVCFAEGGGRSLNHLWVAVIEYGGGRYWTPSAAPGEAWTIGQGQPWHVWPGELSGRGEVQEHEVWFEAPMVEVLAGWDD